MRRLFNPLREHLHFFFVVTLLTLVMTFPTIVYVFRTDVFWLPTGNSHDVFIKIWDSWYLKQILVGEANLYFTDKMFFPHGVTLAYHPLFLHFALVSNTLQNILPVSNAFSLTFLLSVVFSAFTSYLYLFYVLKDTWIALFGAVVFAFSPHVMAHPNHPDVGFVATLPLILYFFHRGVIENRRAFTIGAGLLTGLNTFVIMYVYICALITLGLYVCAFAWRRWRQKRYWIHVILILLAIAVTSVWRIYPMMQNSQGLGETLAWANVSENSRDLISYFVNYRGALTEFFFSSVLQLPTPESGDSFSFLGFLPPILAAIGLANRATRRRMLPWIGLCLLFLMLRMGSYLSINGITYFNIALPKYYLDRLLPVVFQAFYEPNHFQIGVLLPFALLACYGLTALRQTTSVAVRPWFILLLIAIVALEYYIPVKERVIPQERFAFIDWLAKEDDEQIRLINLPMGRKNSKDYNLYQSISGYPHAEGAISRTPDSAFDYIRSNYALNAWYNQRAVTCGDENRNSYLTALDRLEDDGFSHVVFYRDFYFWKEISDSFRAARPSYRDDYVSIYRMSDLRESCE